MRPSPNHRGFSLLEVLVTTSLIALLCGVCFPLYSYHLINANRAEAKTTLVKLSVAL
jgi:type IV pilus assembly protein PilE